MVETRPGHLGMPAGQQAEGAPGMQSDCSSKGPWGYFFFLTFLCCNYLN